MKKTLLLLAALTLSPALYAQDYHVVLWDNATAPTSNGLTGEEIQPKPGQWSNTQKAEMWIYKAGDNATGQALVFFPGGGYSTLSVGNGHKEAKWFAENGVTAAVVKYRLPNGHSEVPRNDADEALRVMREMAAELNIDPAKVGVSGTSAGGYLAGRSGVKISSGAGTLPEKLNAVIAVVVTESENATAHTSTDAKLTLILSRRFFIFSSSLAASLRCISAINELSFSYSVIVIIRSLSPALSTFAATDFKVGLFFAKYAITVTIAATATPATAQTQIKSTLKK